MGVEWRGGGCRGEKNAIRLVSRDKTKIKKDADSGSNFSPNGQKQTERVRRNQIREKVKKDEKNLKAVSGIAGRTKTGGMQFIFIPVEPTARDSMRFFFSR